MPEISKVLPELHFIQMLLRRHRSLNGDFSGERRTLYFRSVDYDGRLRSAVYILKLWKVIINSTGKWFGSVLRLTA